MSDPVTGQPDEIEARLAHVLWQFGYDGSLANRCAAALAAVVREMVGDEGTRIAGDLAERLGENIALKAVADTLEQEVARLTEERERLRRALEGARREHLIVEGD